MQLLKLGWCDRGAEDEHDTATGALKILAEKNQWPAEQPVLIEVLRSQH